MALALAPAQDVAPTSLTNAAPFVPPLQPRPDLNGTTLPNPDPSLTLRPAPPPPPESYPSGEAPTFASLAPSPAAPDLAAHLLVVYNSNDPDSKGLADYYAKARAIPAERVLAIACPILEEVTRQQYEDTIREPIISYIYQKNWMTRRSETVRLNNRMAELLLATRNDIWAIVLMRGVPLKIAPDPSREDTMEPQPELHTNAACVDSELALLPVVGLPPGGFVPNIFFDAAATGLNHAGPDLATKIVLVTRLDGPKPSDVRRMIDDSLYAEQNRLAGLAVIDSRGFTDVTSSYTSGDIWLRKSRDLLVADGWTVDFDDKPDVLPATDPCNQVALYFGWYTGGAQGPWTTAPDRFVRGAIAYHLHSFSATTLRSATGAWAGPLIAHGAAATMGTVYEPYLALTPHIDIFTKRLLQGDSFAEASYASQKGLSWMTTFVGDPLYRPFAKPLETAIAEQTAAPTDHREWLQVQQIQRQIGASPELLDTVGLERAFTLDSSGPILHERLADRLEKLTDPNAAVAAEEEYKLAFTLYRAPVDCIRVGLKLAQHNVARNQDEEAQNELRKLSELFPFDAPRFGVVNQLVPAGAPVVGTSQPALLQPLQPPTPRAHP